MVVIGASAGGVPALIALLSTLPADFPLPILVVQHLSSKERSNLVKVLGWRTALTVKWAEQGEYALPGTVYVAPPDQHLIVGNRTTMLLSSAPKSGWWRPAVDKLFLSAAAVCDSRVIGVILSGAMWDGAKGMASIARAGGITIAQDAGTSIQFDMPAAAIDIGRADLVLPLGKIGEILKFLATVRTDGD